MRTRLVTTAALALSAGAALAPGALAQVAPDVSIASTPRLFAKPVSRVADDQAFAWVVFSTRTHVDARLLQAEAHGQLGRAFGIGGNCIKATFTSRDAGRPVLRPGSRYRVRLHARPTSRSDDRKPLGTYELRARSFGTADSASSPTCDTPSTPRSASTTRARGLAPGTKATVGVRQLLIYPRAGSGSFIGSLQRDDRFTIRRLSASGRWAYGRGSSGPKGWVRTAGLR